MAAELKIAPKTLRKHFPEELRRGGIRAHFVVRKTLYRMGTSGRNTRATKHADKVWDRMCTRRSGPNGQPMPPPLIVIRTDDPETRNAEGGPDR